MTAIATGISSASTRTLDRADQALIEEMLTQWGDKLSGNRERQAYYDQKMLLKDLRISTPPKLRNLEAVLGWPAKTVDVLSDRIQFEKWISPGDDEDPLGLNAVAIDNDFHTEISQATTSMLTASCAFMTVTQGMDGEPDILWLSRSAEQATGLWNKRSRQLKAGMTVSTSSSGIPEQFFVYLPDKTVELELVRGRFRATSLHNPTGRVLMEPLRHKADLRRPFGHSRITPTVLNLTDRAIRTTVRSEIGAEFFTAPQRYGLGIDEMDLDKWTAVMGRLLTVGRDEEGELPQLGQFPQISMTPHQDQMRMWASMMAGESGVPMDELGFPSDNPASDSAIQSQRDPMRLAADKTIRSLQGSLKRLAVTTVMLRDGSSTVPDDAKQVIPWFAPTFRLSDSAAGDVAIKYSQAVPWLAESSVLLEKMNLSQQQIERALADKRKAQSRQVLESALSSPAPVVDDSADAAPAGVTDDDAG